MFKCSVVVFCELDHNTWRMDGGGWKFNGVIVAVFFCRFNTCTFTTLILLKIYIIGLYLFPILGVFGTMYSLWLEGINAYVSSFQLRWAWKSGCNGILMLYTSSAVLQLCGFPRLRKISMSCGLESRCSPSSTTVFSVTNLEGRGNTMVPEAN